MTSPTVLSELHPVMTSTGAPEWSAATWVGMLDLPVELADFVELTGSAGYLRARLLVRHRGRPVAFADTDVIEGRVDGAVLAGVVAEWNVPERDIDEAVLDGRLVPPLPAITVVVCTRDRTALLRDALDSILNCDYPNFDIVVVDNAASDDETVRYVHAMADPRVRVITEGTPGLAVARNAGIRVATGEVVAFTDDDVVVDSYWLRRLAEAFTDDRVGCVTGIVPSGELRSPTQSFFEKQVNWSNSLERRVFDLNNPPPNARLFPFQVGLYGTGASFAMPRGVASGIGGFDEGLGAGSPSGGGEDIDAFVRILTSGYLLVYEPAAIVWHRHRADVPALTAQARGYGVGLGAWLTKVALDRTLRPLALRRAADALLHLREVTRTPSVDDFTTPRGLRHTLLIAILRGPLAYAHSRRQGRRPTPLRP